MMCSRMLCANLKSARRRCTTASTISRARSRSDQKKTRPRSLMRTRRPSWRRRRPSRRSSRSRRRTPSSTMRRARRARRRRRTRGRRRRPKRCRRTRGRRASTGRRRSERSNRRRPATTTSGFCWILEARGPTGRRLLQRRPRRSSRNRRRRRRPRHRPRRRRRRAAGCWKERPTGGPGGGATSCSKVQSCVRARRGTAPTCPRLTCPHTCGSRPSRRRTRTVLRLSSNWWASRARWLEGGLEQPRGTAATPG